MLATDARGRHSRIRSFEFSAKPSACGKFPTGCLSSAHELRGQVTVSSIELSYNSLPTEHETPTETIYVGVSYDTAVTIQSREPY